MMWICPLRRTSGAIKWIKNLSIKKPRSRGIVLTSLFSVPSWYMKRQVSIWLIWFSSIIEPVNLPKTVHTIRIFISCVTKPESPASPCMQYDIPMRHERWRQVFHQKFFKRCSVMHLFLRLWIVMFTSQTIPCLMPPHYLKLVLPKYRTISNARVSFLLP